MSVVAPEVIAGIKSRNAHHEAGHAVAVVISGGNLIHVKIADDWADPESIDWDSPAGVTRHRSPWDAQPFIAFAGPCAEALWATENDFELGTFAEELSYAFWEENLDGDTAQLEARLEDFNPFDHDDWIDEVTRLWPVIKSVAALVLDGVEVTHEMVVDLMGEP